MVGWGEGSEPTDIIGNHLNTLALTTASIGLQGMRWFGRMWGVYPTGSLSLHDYCRPALKNSRVTISVSHVVTLCIIVCVCNGIVLFHHVTAARD